MRVHVFRWCDKHAALIGAFAFAFGATDGTGVLLHAVWDGGGNYSDR